MAQWEIDTKAQIKKTLKKFQKLAKEYIESSANEAQTRIIVNGILEDMLGYDRYSDISVEQMTHHDFMDYGIKIGGELKMIIEAKASTVKLTERHLEQVTNYALDDGVEWVVITNGHAFRLYRITNGLPLVKDLVLHFDILDENLSTNQIIDNFLYLSKACLKRGFPLTQKWKQVVSVSPSTIKEALISQKVLTALRSQLKTVTGVQADLDELQSQLSLMLTSC
jgi:hypothetical protein